MSSKRRRLSVASFGVFVFVISFLAFTHFYRVGSPWFHEDFSLDRFHGAYGWDFALVFNAAKVMRSGQLSFVEYPPLTMLSYMPLTFLDQMLAYRLFTAAIVAALFLMLFFSLAESRVVSDGNAAVLAAILTAALYHSYWFQFELHQGNSNTVAVGLSAAGLYFLGREKTWLAVVFLALAAQWRVYPALLGVFLLSRVGLKTFLGWISLNVGLLLVLGPRHLMNFLRLLIYWQNQEINQPVSHSLLSTAARDGFSHMAATAAGAACLLVFAALFCAYWLVSRRASVPGRPAHRGRLTLAEVALVGVACQVMDLIPSYSLDYKLSLHALSLILLLTRPAEDFEAS
ncbi:MAG: DUF2029 domain-containing protein, partial [Elusimicrobia bacterium]|nr:DUF2029 domain-containing protein [Elusimicrobiota bacterium]